MKWEVYEGGNFIVVGLGVVKKAQAAHCHGWSEGSRFEMTLKHGFTKKEFAQQLKLAHSLAAFLNSTRGRAR